jgi:HrpA-like RNA helicase
MAVAGKQKPKWGISEAEITKVIELIAANRVCGIIAPTGSGKSTSIIEAIYKTDAKVFVSEPTIPAAEGLFRYMGERLGAEKVGMAAEGNVRYTSKTSIVYCTAGHLHRKMLQYFKKGKLQSDMNFCDVIVVDEAHGGTLDNEIIMGLWLSAVKDSEESGSNFIVPRMVLASATLTMPDTPFPDAPSHEIHVKGFPVKVEWHNKDHIPDSKELFNDTARVIAVKHSLHPPPLKGSDSWMVFCSGSGEVEAICDVLKTANDATMEIIPLYSNLSHEDIAIIYKPVPIGKRRIIVATNIAEASITIDGLSGIFDTLTEKYGETSTSGGFRLRTNHISKSSARQRMGRTGRTCPGFCYRMCTERFYQERLADQRIPEIDRVPIHSAVIEILKVGLEPEIFFGKRTSVKRIRESKQLLTNLEMIRDGNITKLGTFAPEVPLSVRGAAILWHWIQTGKPIFPCVAAICMIDCYGPNYCFYPRKQPSQNEMEYREQLDDHYEKYFRKFEGEYDIEMLLNIWRDAMQSVGSIHPHRHDLVSWCQTNSINHKRIAEAINIVRQTVNSLRRLKHTVEIGDFRNGTFMAAFNPILQSVYRDRVYTSASEGPPYFEPSGGLSFMLDRRAPLQRSVIIDAPRVIALITAEIEGRIGGRVTRVISLSHPASEEAAKPLSPVEEEKAKPERGMQPKIVKPGLRVATGPRKNGFTGPREARKPSTPPPAPKKEEEEEVVEEKEAPAVKKPMVPGIRVAAGPKKTGFALPGIRKVAPKSPKKETEEEE